MKKKLLILSLSSVLAVGTAAVTLLLTNKGGLFKETASTEPDYTLTFKAGDLTMETDLAEAHGSTELVTDSTKEFAPARQNKVKFNYEYAPYSDSGPYTCLTQNLGYFENDFESPIRSIKSINLKGSYGQVSIKWGWSNGASIEWRDYDNSYVQASGYEFYFNYDKPNYFRVSALNSSTALISEVKITYDSSCEASEDPYIIENGLKYKRYGVDGLKLLGFSGSSVADLVIPSEVQGRDVVRIAAEAFSYNNTIESVYFPNTIEYIENRAFYNDIALTTLEWQSGSRQLGFGSNPFGGNSNLTGEFLIPSRGANNITQYSFDNMYGISSFRFEDNYNGGTYKCVDGVLYYGNTKLHTYPQQKADSTFTVPSTVTSFNEYVGMRYAKHVETIIFENASPLKLSSYCCASCPNLVDVQFNGTAPVTLEWRPFGNCGALRNLTLPANTVCNGKSFADLGADAAHPLNVYVDGDDISGWNNDPYMYNGKWSDNKGEYVRVYLKAESQIDSGDLPESVAGSWHLVEGRPMAFETKTINVQSNSTYSGGDVWFALWAWTGNYGGYFFYTHVAIVDYLTIIEIPENFESLQIIRMAPGKDAAWYTTNFPDKGNGDYYNVTGDEQPGDDDLATIDGWGGGSDTLTVSWSKAA